MEHIIHIAVQDKIATQTDRTVYICGNSDFAIDFSFDEEWAATPVKTARLIDDDDKHWDIVFEGNICPVPVLTDTFRIRVGVFAGNLQTTTPAYVPAKKSILCAGGSPAAPAEDVYAQIMDKLNETANKAEELFVVRWGDGFTAEDVRKAVSEGKACVYIYKGEVLIYAGEMTDRRYINATATYPTFESPVKYADGVLDTYSAQLREDGNSAIFTNKRKIVNPKSLKLTGAVNAEYDGSKAVTVNIPEGGSGKQGEPGVGIVNIDIMEV